MKLSDKSIAIINALVTHFYDVVPHEYKTYCALTARISQSVLTHFGIEAKLLPCQVWLTTEEHNFIVGFVGKLSPRKWDGHVVCRAENLIIDAALKHFEHEFGMRVPSMISTPCFDVPTQVISRCDLSTGSCLWWHYPPASPKTDLNLPDEPQDLIAKYAAQLIVQLAASSTARDISPLRGMTETPARTSNS